MPHMAYVYTVSQAAQHLGLAARTVRKYCAEGRLPATKVGRDWMIYGLEVSE